MKKMYCLVVIDDYSKFSWVFFLATKHETCEILKTFITGIENLIDLKVKVIRCDNGTKFKNKVMNQFCEIKGIKREFSVARTPQQNRVAERKNRTLIKATRTMLADSKLPTTFWAEAVNTTCYVQNRVLVIKPHNKTPYELFLGRKPAISFMRQFGCLVTILNTIDHLGKFDGKANEGFFIGYSTNNKAFREMDLIGFFDIDALTKSMNYEPVVAGNQSNGIPGTKACENAGKARVETVPSKDYILLPFLTQDPPFSSSSKDSPDVGFKPSRGEEKKDVEHIENEDSEVPNTEETRVNQEQDESVNSTNNINTVSSTVNTASIEDNVVDENIVYGCVDDPNMPNLEENFYLDDDENVDAEADMTNLDTHILVSPTPTTRIHKDHPLEQIIRDIHSAPQTRRMTKSVTGYGMISSVQQRINHKDFQNCLFACFLSQVKPKKVIQALTDPSWIEAMQDELLQFKLQKGYTQEEGIDYDEVFALVARIEAIRLFLAYASFKNFVVYQMDVKSAFLYGKIEEEVYVCQPLKFEDPKFPDRVYKVEKALYGLHQAPRAWYETLSTYLLDNGFQRGQIDKTLFIKRVKGDILLVQVYVDDIIFGSTKKSLCTEFEKLMHKKFQMSSMGELTFFLGLQVTQKDDGIFISQDKYVDEILKKFGFSTVKTASTPMETSKPLLKDAEAEDVDVYLYRSMIGSLMYLTSSRPDIMFAVCACARFQVTPKVSHLYAVKRIFRYLKGQPKLGLWYPKDSPFDLEAYSDSDYAGASLDRKSTTGGCQFLGSRLISWQCKKQTIVANSTTKVEYLVAAGCHGQFWATAKTKTVNGEVQIQALVDGKKVIVIKTSVRRALQLKDAEGTECLPNATIFAELERIGAKTTAWNEFSSTMASTIICLATNQKFNFSKYIFDNMVKNLEGGVKFLMYPREKEKKKQPRRKQRKDTEVPQPSGFTKPITDEAANEEHVHVHSNDPLLSGEDRLKLNELMEVCTNLSQRVLDLENIKTSQAAEITKLKERVKKLERRNKSRTPGLKRLRKVGRSAQVVSSKDEGVFDEEEVEVEKVVSTAEVTTASTTTTVDAMDGGTYELAQRLQAEEQDSFVPMDTKVVKGSKSQAGGSSKRIGEELESDNSKKQKIDENVEAEVDDEAEMKKHMEKVPDDEVAIDAIPLATKSPIIVDWKIIKEGKMDTFKSSKLMEV
ncbi:putative ribonuclease H-like domain-containing protein [Tanacetum coccineum]